MKTMKHSGKKILSVFLAVLMVMTAWGFVAPTEAQAAATYPVTVKFNNPSSNPSGHMRVYYFNVNSDGSVDTSNTSQNTIIINSLSGDGYGAAGNQSAGPFNIPGWPWKVEVRAERGTTVRFLGFYVGNIEVTGMVANNNEGYNVKGAITKSWAYNDNTNLSSGSIAKKNWEFPAVSSVRSAPTAQTISVPKNGSASKTFTAYFNDQYGMQWPSSNGISATLASNLGGTSVALSGNTATVSANELVFANSGYNATTGQIKTTLQMIQNDVTASCDVVFQSPKYNAYLNYYSGDNAKTYSNIGYYNQSVTLSDFPANSTPTQLTGNDQQHQTYTWPVNATQAFNITGDTTFTEIKGTPADHNFDKNGSGSVDADDYTTTDGNHSLTCADCGYTKTQAHKSGTGYVTKEETCTEDGVMTYDCSICGKKAIATSAINTITGHNFTGTAVENVEGENGNHWRKCSRCDAYGWGTTENARENHNWDKNLDGTVDASDAVTKASTCKEAGYEKYTCQVCSATWTKTLDLAAHTTTATAAKDVTNVCGGDGNAAFWSCSVCDRVWTDAALTNEISNADADNDGIPDAAETKGPSHNFTGAYRSVTAGKDGTHNRACSICGKYGIDNTEGATEPHVWGALTVVDATCTKEGTKTYKCKHCPQTYDETISKVAHTMTKIDAVTPVCGKAGNNEYYLCSTCGKYYKDEAGTTVTTVEDEKIAALQHKWTEHHDYDTLKTAADCMNPAVYYNHCDYCKVLLTGATHYYGDPNTVNGHKFDGEIKKNDDGTHSYKCTVAGCPEYGNKTNCDYEVTADVASTCKTPGYTTYTCTVCKNGYSTTKGLDPNNHKGEGTYIIASSEPTCATRGSTGIEKCSGCDETLSSKINDIPVDLTKHENMQDYEGKAATCQTEGYKAYKYCDQCGTYEIEKVAISVKDHVFTKYTSNGDGTHTATCDTCDPTVGTPATKDGNCSGGTANCVDKAVCTVCSGEYGNVDSANHKTVITVKKKDSTCQTEGYEAYRKCEACNVDIDPITPIAKKNHVYSSWSANNDGTHSRSCTTCDAAVADVAIETAGCSGGVATCIARAKCEVCKAEYGEKNSANHDTEAATLKNAKEASCTEEGYTGDRHYDCCNAIKEKGTAIPMLDHKYTVALENTKVASTCTEKGSIDYQCETCTATEKRELELNPQNHSSEETIVVNDKAATCESDGYTGDTYHKCCYKPGGSTAENRYALISKGTVIKANGQHVYSAAVPEYMIDEIVEEKDAEGNVTSRSIKLKTEEPDYAKKITYRRADNYWYHKQICTICYEVVETRCYTYPDHQADCVNTDSCFVCKGLCSLTNPDKHTLKEIEKISATCEKNGRKAYYVCEACGKEFFDLAGKNEITDENKSQLVIPSTMKHTIDRDDTPTQAKDDKGNVIPGKHAYSCSVCGTAIVEACSGGEATCKDKAKCEYCGVEYGELNKNKHVKGTIIQGNVAPDRCKPGVSGKTVYECCPDVVVYEGDIIPATEPHDWKETTDKADNCANGYTITKTCNYCGEVETTEVAAGTHDLSVVVYETEKDCKKERTIYYACSICGFTDKEVEIDGVTYKYIFAEVIEAKEDCTWTSWTYEQKPSCVVEGKKTRKCLACGKTEEEILPKTDHTIKTEAGYAATCDKAGKQDYVYCVIEGCPYAKGGAPIGQLAGYEKYKDCNGKVIEALGHGDHNGDDYCDHCGGFLHENEDGTNCNCICHKRHWFMRIIYKILRFFWKLFGISRTCCSAGVHY